ncbi:hypothetical protein CDIK_2188 [Cucumispora dikerogammari]|nr:hypothetical protein CDIK_2188 [Cucumispora dikerogammari]
MFSVFTALLNCNTLLPMTVKLKLVRTATRHYLNSVSDLSNEPENSETEQLILHGEEPVPEAYDDNNTLNPNSSSIVTEPIQAFNDVLEINRDIKTKRDGDPLVLDFETIAIYTIGALVAAILVVLTLSGVSLII